MNSTRVNKSICGYKYRRRTSFFRISTEAMQLSTDQTGTGWGRKGVSGVSGHSWRGARSSGPWPWSWHFILIVKNPGMCWPAAVVSTPHHALELPEGFTFGHCPQYFWNSRSQVELKMDVSNKFLGDADVAFPETKLWKPLR